ncbi:DUF6009 family protein [Streptomyces sp. A012304]|uniref:DUF6009 family protein n=1 Tax=Streptomyces sp. A012304 TaxID=375446 RepID=UPI00222F73D9|nr:DUF6009 family protein [Streptomyces sp. A012304]GKQ33535.1 hypothetical protein ALMP_00860 [Streptomyces sp. A012304]
MTEPTDHDENSPCPRKARSNPMNPRVQGPTETDFRNVSPTENDDTTPAPHTYGEQSLSVPHPRIESGLTCENTAGTDEGTHQGPNTTKSSAAPTTRLTPEQLAAETEIVWTVPIDDLDYVRESLDITKRRSGKPPYHQPGRLVGYANLAPNTTATRDSGRYDRRTFWLLPRDRSESDDSPYTTYAPLEAVDPRTVAPGCPGRLTRRALRGAGPEPGLDPNDFSQSSLEPERPGTEAPGDREVAAPGEERDGVQHPRHGAPAGSTDSPKEERT